MSLHVLYEDNHLIAVEKPAGLLTQGDSSGDPTLFEAVKEYIRTRYAKPGGVFLGIVQRLDRPVSGIVVFARTSKAAERLNAQFRGRSVIKVYLALVECGTADLPHDWTLLNQHLVREKDVTRTVALPGPGTQQAGLAYRALWRGKDRALLLVRLFTGRKHQIRAQLCSQDMPVCGDTRYGASPSADGSIRLHAVFLGLEHPTKKIPVRLFCGCPSIEKELGPDWPAAEQTMMELLQEMSALPAGAGPETGGESDNR